MDAAYAAGETLQGRRGRRGRQDHWEGRRQHRDRASPAGRDEWGHDKLAGRGPAWNCESASRAAELAVVVLVLALDGSAVAAGAPPCRDAEVPRGARPVVQPDSGAAAGAEVFLELGSPADGTIRLEAARYGPPDARAELPTLVASAPPELLVAKAAADPTRSGPDEAWEPGEPERDQCVWVDAAEQRQSRTVAVSRAQVCCEAVLQLY